MTLHRLNHAFAFLFGGYQDYDQFYTPSLLDEDGGLFVAILERLSEGKQQSGPSSVGNKLDQSAAATTERIEGDVEAQQHDHGSGEIEQISQPTMEPSSVSFRMTGDDVNPVRLAAAHVQLKLLKGHNYNIFEAAFFCDPEGDKGEYYLNMLQVIATYLGMSYLFYFLGNEIKRVYQNRGDVWLKDDEGNDKEWGGILVINAIALGYFFFILGGDVERVANFNGCMRKLCPDDQHTSARVKSHHWWSLWNNHFFNIIMGHCLFVLNFFFVQSTDDMIDAILNALAVIFIIQFDDVIRPYRRVDRTVYFLNIQLFPITLRYWLDWGNSGIHGKLMAIVEAYLRHPTSSSEQVTVKKKNKTKGESVIYREKDVCYFFVNKEKSLIRVFRGRLQRNEKYMHMFKEVEYRIDGPGAAAFLDNMAGFESVEQEKGPKKLEVHLQKIHLTSEFRSSQTKN